MKEIFCKLSSSSAWSLQLLNARVHRGVFMCNAHEITVTTSNALIEFIRELESAYTKEKGRLSEYQAVCEYDGSTIGNCIYKIESSDNLISESCNKLIDAVYNPDMRGNALDFPANAYVLKGNVFIEGESIPIKLFTIINPFKVLKHTFACDGDSFKMLSDRYLALRGYIDVAMIGNMIYLFNMNGEKLSNMERAYKAICNKGIEDIIYSEILSDENMFRKYAASGHNPRRFVSYDEERLQKVRSDLNFRNKMANKFGIDQTPEGKLDSSNSNNVNKIVKFLCRKGMIDPVNEAPVEVEGARRWM